MSVMEGIMHSLRISKEGFAPWFDAYRLSVMKKPAKWTDADVATFEKSQPLGAKHADVRKVEGFTNTSTYAGAGAMFTMGTLSTGNPIVGAVCGALGGAAGFSFGNVMGRALYDVSLKEAHASRAEFYKWMRLEEAKAASKVA